MRHHFSSKPHKINDSCKILHKKPDWKYITDSLRSYIYCQHCLEEIGAWFRFHFIHDRIVEIVNTFGINNFNIVVMEKKDIGHSLFCSVFIYGVYSFVEELVLRDPAHVHAEKAHLIYVSEKWEKIWK